MSKYHDRSRCEAEGLAYGRTAIGGTMTLLEQASDDKDIPSLDLLATHLNLQCAAFLESMYERAGVISGGES